MTVIVTILRWQYCMSKCQMLWQSCRIEKWQLLYTKVRILEVTVEMWSKVTKAQKKIFVSMWQYNFRFKLTNEMIIQIVSIVTVKLYGDLWWQLTNAMILWYQSDNDWQIQYTGRCFMSMWQVNFRCQFHSDRNWQFYIDLIVKVTIGMCQCYSWSNLTLHYWNGYLITNWQWQ